jgi:hypothetical protein
MVCSEKTAGHERHCAVQQQRGRLGRFNGIMIATAYLGRIAAWSRQLNERELEIARRYRREIVPRQ